MRQFLFFLILAAGVACAGDAGGLHTKADLERVVAQGQVSPVDGLSSAGQPDAAALRVFAANGYVAVIDMRQADEERGFDEPATVQELGMEYIPFPIGKQDITLDKARELDELLGQYDQPVLLHCGSGNRVGALLALRDYLATGDEEQALQKGRDSGLTRLEETVKKVLAEPAQE